MPDYRLNKFVRESQARGTAGVRAVKTGPAGNMDRVASLRSLDGQAAVLHEPYRYGEIDLNKQTTAQAEGRELVNRKL
jgi:hypothetical protein